MRKNKSSLPRISIITPSCNQGKFIEKNIKSVLNQHYKNFEHIVIDGGSKDNTVAILKKYSHLKWVSEKDSGQSHAFNKGLKMATGQIIGWINSDDYLVKNIFREVAGSFDKNTDWVIGNIFIEYRIINKKIADVSPKISLSALQKKPDIVRQQGAFFRKEILEKVGGLDEKIQIAMDCELWFRLAKRSEPKMINRRWAYFVFHKDQKTSGKNLIRQTNQAIRILLKYRSPCLYIFVFAFRNYFYFIKYIAKICLIKAHLLKPQFVNISYFNKKLK